MYSYFLKKKINAYISYSTHVNKNLYKKEIMQILYPFYRINFISLLYVSYKIIERKLISEISKVINSMRRKECVLLNFVATREHLWLTIWL